MNLKSVKELIDAIETALYGGGGDTPDHCYWAGTEILKVIREEVTNSKLELPAEINKELSRLEKECQTEGLGGEDEDEGELQPEDLMTEMIC